MTPRRNMTAAEHQRHRQLAGVLAQQGEARSPQRNRWQWQKKPWDQHWLAAPDKAAAMFVVPHNHHLHNIQPRQLPATAGAGAETGSLAESPPGLPRALPARTSPRASFPTKPARPGHWLADESTEQPAGSRIKTPHGRAAERAA